MSLVILPPFSFLLSFSLLYLFFQNVLQLGHWVRAASLRQSDPAGDVRRKDRGHAGSIKIRRREEEWKERGLDEANI